MKHNTSVTLLLVAIFLLTQLFGVFVLYSQSDVSVDEDGNVEVAYEDTAVGERPEMTGLESLLYVGFAILLGTGLVLILRRFKQVRIWRLWFSVAVFFCCLIALGAFMPRWIAGLLALIITLWKTHRPNVIIHNLSEILLYSGIAFLIAPLFDVLWATVLLLLISGYDMYAVWKSKHMIDMAKFQAESNLFAGLFIPYEDNKVHLRLPKDGKLVSHAHGKPVGVQRAILGGGDVAFPLIFNVAVFTWLIEGLRLSKLAAYMWTLFPILGVTIALALLFFFSQKGKFYPAMPFLSTGCFLGYCAMILFL